MQQGDGYYCSSRTFEVMPMRIDRMPYGWKQYHESADPWGESSVFMNVPPEFLAEYIMRQGISQYYARLLPVAIRQCLLYHKGHYLTQDPQDA